MFQRGLVDYRTARNAFIAEQLSKNLQNLSTPTDMHSWQTSHSCDLCSLVLRNDSILCTKDSVYFMYAQVTFSKNPSKNQTRRVILKRNASFGRSARILTESTFPHTTEGSVWVAKIVSLLEGDSVILNITDDFLRDSKYTFWGAYPLH